MAQTVEAVWSDSDCGSPWREKEREREKEGDSRRQASLDYESSMNRGLSAAINQF